jgi:hypothetical protein
VFEGVRGPFDDGFTMFSTLPTPIPEPGVKIEVMREILAEWREIVREKGGEEDDPAWPGDGPVLANGPHRKGPTGTSGWLRLAARAGRRRKVAAVVQADVVSWYLDHATTCDAEVQLGRMDYDLPPGLPTAVSGNERCSLLLLWDPETRGQEVQPAILEVEDDRGKLRRCPLRAGLRDAPVVRVPNTEGRSGSSA